MKIGLFIDYYDAGEKSRELFSECLRKFLDCGYDIFLISNNVTSIDIPINELKYFEYDSENRLFKSDLRPFCQIIGTNHNLVDCEDNTLYDYSGAFGVFNPADWSVFYNISKAAQVMKAKGYDYMLKIDYDVILKNYDVLGTVFKGFNGGMGQTIDSPCWRGSKFQGLLNNFLLSTDLILSSIPLNSLATSEGYRDWVYSLSINDFKDPELMPIFEVIFGVLFRDKTKIIPYQTLNEELITLDGNTNNTWVFEPPFLNYDNMTAYPILAAYINELFQPQLMISNMMNKKCFFKIRENVFCLKPNHFRLFPGDDETIIETPAGETRITKKEWSRRRISGQLIKQ